MGILDRVQRQQQLMTTGKAISHHPELEGRTHILRQTTSGLMMEDLADYADYAQVFKVYTWVKKAITVISNNFAPLPLRVVDEDGEGQETHPLSLLFAYANDQMPPKDLWQAYIIHKMLGGESFFEVVEGAGGQPVELWPRRPDEVGLKPDVSRERVLFPRVAHYLWPDEKGRVEPELMWHDKFYNPLNQWRGLAPVSAVRHGIIIDMFAQAWSKSFLRKGARPDFALMAPQGITRSEREEYEFKLMDKFSGSDNWHKPIILEEGVTDIKTFSFPPKDIEWLEQRKFSRDEVGAIFGVPDGIMGYGRESYDNADKLNAHLRALWTLTIGPLVESRDVSLTHFFGRVRQDLEPGLKIETDLSGVGVLQEDDAPQIEKAKNLFSMGVPFNTINERLSLDVGDIPGGDVGYLPVNLLPVGSEPPAPEPLPPNGDEEPVDEEPAEEEMAMSAFVTKQGITYGSDRHTALWKQHRTLLTRHERPMIRELKRRFQEQQNDVLRRFRELASAGGADAEQKSSTKVTIDLPTVDDLFNRREQTRLFVSVFRRYYNDAATDFGERQAEQFGIDWSLRSPLAEQALAQANQQFAQRVTDTTWREIRGALGAALEEGLSIPDTQELLNDAFNGRKSGFETERIARTEISKASSIGSLDAAREAQVLGLRVRKGWIAALDGRTRDAHRAAHIRYQENPIGVEENFEIGGCTGPGPSQTGCPEHDINCRCSISYVTMR